MTPLRQFQGPTDKRVIVWRQCKCMKLVHRMFYIRVYPYPVAHNHPSSQRPFWLSVSQWQCASLMGSSSMRKMGINSMPVSCWEPGSDAWGKMKWADEYECLVYSDRVNALPCFYSNRAILEKKKKSCIKLAYFFFIRRSIIAFRESNRFF